MPNQNNFDVVVVGAGSAALNAALSAKEQGSKVLVLEKAPEHLRGGNSYFTGGLFRFAYSGLEEIVNLLPEVGTEEQDRIDVGSYDNSDFYADVMRVTEGLSNPDLLQILVSESYPTMIWMRDQGVPWILAYGRQAFEHEGKLRFWGGLIVESVGGGKGLSDRLFELCQNVGIEVRYQSAATELKTDNKGKISGVIIKGPDGYEHITCHNVVLACGGFEANAEMRTRYLGPGWELAKVRGTQYNTGEGIQMALDIGAQSHGHWSGCHAVAWDLNAPPHGDRNVADLFQKHSYPFGLIVNVDGERFVDEGADFRNYTYAKYGREILKQPQRAAFQLFDQKSKHLLRDEYFIQQATMVESDTIEQLAEGLDINVPGLVKTIYNYNESVQDGEFNPTDLDGKGTIGLTPPKSNWAQKFDSPPYIGYAVTCGITFTFGGLKIDTRCRVQDTSDVPIPGLYAAGELTGGLFYNNYPGGAGLMAGAVFGKIAGREAGQRSS
ncbi:MAG: FAD-dependent tricarballylate dehydrogenase TcuA [Chloroflexota bacterium]|nr:FAD-dependent tricarballylate dehydrogenase TcuA [Chloroflexota bacterium]